MRLKQLQKEQSDRKHTETLETNKSSDTPAISDDGYLSISDRVVRTKKRIDETSEECAAHLLTQMHA